MHDSTGHGPGALCRDYFHCKQAGIVGAGSLFFFNNRQSALGGDNIAVDDINSFLAGTFQQSPDYRCLQSIGIVVGDIAVILDAYCLGLPLGKFLDQFT